MAKPFIPKTNKIGEFVHNLEPILDTAKQTVNFAPMLCILFIGARMRALQMDPKTGNPQVWAQRCFYVCTYSVLVQAIMVVILPYSAPNVKVDQGPVEGDVVFKNLNPGIATVVT